MYEIIDEEERNNQPINTNAMETSLNFPERDSPYNFNVFIVEDSDVYRTMLAESLSQQEIDDQNYKLTIYGFSSGEECLENLDLKPHVIILDYHLDGNGYVTNINGMTVLDEVNRLSPSTNVILLSCQQDEKLAHEIIKKGVAGYFKKGPESITHVREKILTMMQINN
ncbi:MAG: hypothetical protein A3H98_01635 [Bacteroidetes bacterium RIFCSPLOWO2_02_FULL_36_8]|nr:MAG: hypothetical protein A3H98_01635 [Bacteroidetes bacterium RIFCSPLOWO2_02_FULL_36_8]OFY69359.1 MAG: hypothetical protein A3G23_00980 [Bacteroidetes bacterium RIFCSPLOWO2_12_FULL_37_12]